jgi:hypothetical protein
MKILCAVLPRLAILAGLLSLGACASKSEEQPDGSGCTDLGCECTGPADCAAPLTCQAGPAGSLCLPPPSDDVQVEDTAPDTTDVQEDVPAPQPDVNVAEVVETTIEDFKAACRLRCDGAESCNPPDVTACTEFCDQADFILLEADPAKLETCSAALLAFGECALALTCEDFVALLDRGSACDPQIAVIDTDCFTAEEEGSTEAPDEGSTEVPDEGSTEVPDEGSAP